MATALITGGTGGLGAPSSRRSWPTAGASSCPTSCRGPHERLPAEAEAVEADLTDPDDVARAVRAAAGDADAPLRAVVNLVGGFAADQPVADTPLADFEAQFALNLRPTYLVTQGALPAPGRRGRRRDRLRLLARGAGAVRRRRRLRAPRRPR